MNNYNTQLKYRTNTSINFTDEITIGEVPVVSSFNNLIKPNPERELKTKVSKKNELEKTEKNNILNYTLLSFFLVATLTIFSKIVYSTFITLNSFITASFIAFYFVLFAFTLFVVAKKKMLSLNVKDGVLQIKSFPNLNEKISLSEIARCEIQANTNNKIRKQEKLHFALNENGNRYKQKLNDGILLQMINGELILIGSAKC